MKHTTMYATSRKVIMQHDSYGMIDTKNNFIVPTKYHLLGSILYNKLEKKGFDQSLYTNWVFYNYENMCIVNAITGTVNTHRWDMEWYILPVKC